MPRFFAICVATLILAGLPMLLIGQFGVHFARPAAVPEVNVEQLLQLSMGQREELFKIDGHYVLVDVRTPEEYHVSLIPGAITKEQFEKHKPQYRDSNIVVYCTTGYRSGQYAQKLIVEGFTAKNFKGSILAWCHAGMPLVTMQGERMNRVHTYSSQYKAPANYTAVY